MAMSVLEATMMQYWLGVAGRVLSTNLNFGGSNVVGMGPVGIAHNLLEGVCGHTSPEIFNLEPSESGFEAFFILSRYW